MTNLLSHATRDIVTLDDYAGVLSEFAYGGNTYGLQGLGASPIQQTLTGNYVESPSNSLTGLTAAGYLSSGPVFACMLARMVAFSAIRFQYQSLRSGRASDLFGTNALRILERPWAGGTTQELLVRMILDADLAGQSYITELDGECVRLRPDWVQMVLIPRKLGLRPDMNKDEVAKLPTVGWRRIGYAYTEGGPGSGNEPALFTAEQVCHFAPQPDPLASYRGISWLTPVIREIQADKLMDQHKRKFFEQGAPQPLSAGVLTPAGWSTMGQMRVGSRVIGSDGKPHRVVAVYPQGERDIYRVRFSGGAEVECTQDHLWTVSNAYDRRLGRTRTLTLRQIMDGGVRYASGAAKWAVQLPDPVEFDGVGDLPVDPYLLGSLLGDKVIPPAYMRAGVKDRVALLQGLVDTDGSVGDGPGFRFTNTSRVLCEQLVELVHGLGGVATVRQIRPQRGNARPQWRVEASMLPDWVVPVRLSRKVDAYVQGTRFGRADGRRILSVELVRRDQAQCISVDNDDHLYVTDGYVLTHNTPNLIVRYPEEVDEDEFERYIELARTKTEGIRRAYGTLYLTGGADVTVAGANFQQIDFKAVQGAGETRIATAAGVPPIIAGFSEGLASATYSNYAQARRRFVDMTVHPLWQMAAGSLEALVGVPDSTSRLWYDTRNVPMLREDAADAATIFMSNATSAKTLIDAGFDPDTVPRSIAANDIELLSHTGRVSVQLQTPGQQQPGDAAPADQQPPQTPAKTQPKPPPAKPGAKS